MSFPDYTDNWKQYWQQAADGRRQRQLELAATDPLGHWLTADAATLVSDPIDIDPDHLRNRPDDLLDAARDGFAAYVEEADIEANQDDRYGYEVVPVHVTTVGQVAGVDFALEDPLADANRLATMSNATVAESARREHEAAIVTYHCPLGHETTVRKPLFRSWTIETCGAADCSNDAVPDDTRTRSRSVARFTVETAAGSLPCVATGRYAETTDEFERLARAKRLHLTGIPRLVTDTNGAIDPTFEVLATEPTAP